MYDDETYALAISMGHFKEKSALAACPAWLALIVTLLFALALGQEASAQSSDDQPLGDVVRSQRQKTKSKVIDEEEMMRRGLHHDADASGIDCDASCEVQVRVQAVQAGRLQVTDAQWQAAFAAGKAELARDNEMLDLLSDWKQAACQIQSHTEDRQKTGELMRHITKKLFDDAFYQNPESIGRATEPGDNPTVNRQRAIVVKIQLVRFMIGRDSRACKVAASPAPSPEK